MAFNSHSPEPQEADYTHYFKDKVVFLLGGTGHLGGCILYKLALQIPVKQILVLHRGTVEKAISKWRTTMPDLINRILETRKVKFMPGDIAEPELGMNRCDLDFAQAHTSIIINTAANISFISNGDDAVRDNCLPPLELARMASKFPKLVKFVQISTAYSLSFMPDGDVFERIYEFPSSGFDPEKELALILAEGATPNTKSFAWPYAQAKYLMERLLVKRYPNLPMLIVIRPQLDPLFATHSRCTDWNAQSLSHHSPDSTYPAAVELVYGMRQRDTKVAQTFSMKSQ